MIFFGRRYYDPEYGRWLTCDPKGFENSLNLYAYVLNDPLTKLDYYGLEINKPDYFPIMDNGNISFGVSWQDNTLASMQYNSIQNLQLSQNYYNYNDLDRWLRQQQFQSNVPRYADSFLKSAVIGFTEVNIGKEFRAPNTKIEAYGRIVGRKVAKLLGDIA